MDASTLVIVLLLISAASIASYLLSQRSFIRHFDRGSGWAAIGLGTTLLLAAATIVVLVLNGLPALQLENQKPVHDELGAVEFDAIPRDSGPPDAASKADPKTNRNNFTANRFAREGSDQRADVETASMPAPIRSGVRPSTESSKDSGSRQVTHVGGPTFAESDPWAATKCVYALNPDPADLTLWTIDNGCGVPVAIILASCWKTPSECTAPQSMAWSYPNDGMILPGKVQRPVTYDEETAQGVLIRYVACIVATPVAIQLIGQSSETRALPSWSQQFAGIRVADACLSRVQNWAIAGRSSGRSIDALASGKTFPARASE